MQPDKAAFLRDVEACFVSGAIATLAFFLYALPDMLTVLPRYFGILGTWRIALNSLASSLLWGGLAGLIFILPVLRGRPYLKGFVLAVLLTLDGLIFSAVRLPPPGTQLSPSVSVGVPSLADMAVGFVYGFAMRALPWALGTAFLLHKVFRAKV